jgi:hypothetical protein
MPVPGQVHCGFPSFPIVDWFSLFLDLGVLPFPLEDCSVLGNFVIIPMYYLVTKPVISYDCGKDRGVLKTNKTYPWSFVTEIFPIFDNMCKTPKSRNRENQSTIGKLGKPQWTWPGTGISNEMVGWIRFYGANPPTSITVKRFRLAL